MKYRNNPLRTLAKSNYYQILYNRAKELNISLFENKSDFSLIQVNFFSWLEAYSSLFTDLALGEEYLDKDVINDELRVEAYFLLKKKKRKEKNKGEFKQEKSSKLPSVVFAGKRKRVS